MICLFFIPNCTCIHVIAMDVNVWDYIDLYSLDILGRAILDCFLIDLWCSHWVSCGLRYILLPLTRRAHCTAHTIADIILVLFKPFQNSRCDLLIQRWLLHIMPFVSRFPLFLYLNPHTRMCYLWQTDPIRIIYIVNHIRPIPMVAAHINLHARIRLRPPRLLAFSERRLAEIRSKWDLAAARLLVYIYLCMFSFLEPWSDLLRGRGVQILGDYQSGEGGWGEVEGLLVEVSWGEVLHGTLGV